MVTGLRMDQDFSTNDALIPKDQVILQETLGEGTFAIVKRAYWKTANGRKDVAVKILRDASPIVMEEIKQEANSLLNLKHTNLIRLYGIVSEMPWMVFELCEGGALLDRLRDRKKPPLLVSTLLDYCQQIAFGMTYLEVKHCVHRDLATRNVLLSQDEKTVKICDFGLMRSLEENERLYIMSPQKRVPFAWCPPESLRKREFSHASDVWAMGVLMWEIFTYGEEPWVGCRGRDVLEKVEAGERLPKPKFCSSQVYDLMCLCWKPNPDHRPKFKMLRGFINQIPVNVADVREPHSGGDDDTLEMRIGDLIHVIDNLGVVWFGQNEGTRCFGTFLRSAVFVRTKNEQRPEQGGSSKISRPIAGSFIHTGHGDVRGGHSWGQPEKIDDIYLKNPVTGRPQEHAIPSIVPTITTLNTESNLGAAGKVKPQLPSKPPASAPSSRHSTIGDAWSEQGPSTSKPNVNFRHAPPPPQQRPQSAVGHNVGGNSVSTSAVPRPIANVHRNSPEIRESSRSANSTPPNIRSEQYMQKVSVPAGGINLTPPPPTHKNSVPTGMGHGSNILGELQKKGFGSADSTVRLRPNASLQETPLFVHSQMGTMGGSAGYNVNTISHVPDPFEVSSAIKSLAAKERYNEVLEKKSVPPFIPQTTSNSHLSHWSRPTQQSSSTPQIGNSFLLPTPVPSSARITTAPQPSGHPLPGISQAALLQQQKRQHQQMQSPRNQQQLTMIQNQINHHQTDASQSRAQPRGDHSPITPSIGRGPVSAQKPPNNSQAQIRNVQNVAANFKEAAVTTTTTAMNNVQKSSTHAALNVTATASNALDAALSSASKHVEKTSAKAQDVVAAVMNSSYKAAEIDVSSLLPPPSALFLSGTSSVSSSTAAKNSTVSSLSRLPVSFHSPSTNGRQSSPASNTTVNPNPVQASVVLPREPLTPTLLYPTLDSIAPPAQRNQPSPSQTPLAQTNPTPSQLTPIFNAQRSVGVFAPTAPTMNSGYGPSGNYNLYPNPQLTSYGSPNIMPMTSYMVPSYSTSYYNSMPMSTNLFSQSSSQFVYPTMQTPLVSQQPRPLSTTSIIHSPDVLNFFDPLNTQIPSTSSAQPDNIPSQTVQAQALTSAIPPPTTNSSGSVTRAEQMEVLYDEASFVDRSVCDWMVGQCNGDIAQSLKRLKVAFLVEQKLAKDAATAMDALESKKWDLNAAAELLLTSS